MTAIQSETLMEILKIYWKRKKKLIINTVEGFDNKSQ